MTVERIVVIGAGTMGNGIAQTAAVSGYQVTMTDVDEAALERGKAAIDKSANLHSPCPSPSRVRP